MLKGPIEAAAPEGAKVGDLRRATGEVMSPHMIVFRPSDWLLRPEHRHLC